MLVGAGRLGARIAKLLSETVQLIVLDFDIVQEKNLAEQPFTGDQVGMHKVRALAEQLPGIVPKAVPFTRTTPLDGIECLVEGTDSLSSRSLINDRVKQAGIPAVFCAGAGGKGIVFTNGDACWECIMEGKNVLNT